MSADSRIKRRKIHHHGAESPQAGSTTQSDSLEALQDRQNSLAYHTTPKKGSQAVLSEETASPSQDADHLVPLSRTLGLFKKYHQQSPSTSPAASPSLARKTSQYKGTLSPSKRSNESPRSSTGSLSTKFVRPMSAVQQGSPMINKPDKQPDTPSRRADVFSRGLKDSSRRFPSRHPHDVPKISQSPSTSRRDDSAIVIEDRTVSEATRTPSKQQRADTGLRKEQSEESDGDEIVVRSSGRKRTISEKLREAREPPKASTQPSAVQLHSLKTTTDRMQAEVQISQQKRKRTAEPDSHKRMLEKENIIPASDEAEEGSPIPETLTSPRKPAALQVTSAISSSLAKTAISEEHFRLVHNAVLTKLTGKQSVPISDLSEQYSKTSALIEQTIAAGESNSMLVIGPRGAGKTTMINQILEEQRVKHADDFHTVRLSGFIHTDDKLALRDIWRQLGREMEINNATHSYADTMSMLLALLSHPTDLGQEVADNMTTKSVIFILDEFDLFATHPRQTLLYNLFDIAQSRRAPIAVLGLTTRVDAAEQLEKRVKSRFSHRYVHLNLAKSMVAYETICRSLLTLDTASYNRKDGEVVKIWNKLVDELFANAQLKMHLNKLYYRTKLIPDFMASMLLPVATLPLRRSTCSAITEHILSRLSTSTLGTTKLDGISALSAIGAAMLVCAARQSIYSIENVSFDIAYEEYKTIASKMKLQATASGGLASSRVWTREVAEVAWLGLVDAGFVVDGRVDVSLTELADCGADLGQWNKWCKEI